MGRFALVTIVLLAASSFSAVSAAPEDELQIESYRFTWVVVESGDRSFAIEKTEDGTRAALRGGFHLVTMKPEDAELVGAALAKTDEMQKKLKGTEKSETVKAGGMKLNFSFTEKAGFYVSVSDAQARIGSSIVLDAKQARAIAPKMRQAKRMAKLVDDKVQI